MEHEGMRLEDFFIAVKRRWIMILLMVVIPTILILFIPNEIQEVEYKANGEIYVLRNDLENVASSPKGSIEYNLLNSFAQFITSDNIISQAIEKENIDVSLETIKKNLTSEIVKDSNIISVSLKGEKEEGLDKILNSIAQVSMENVEEIIPNSTAKLIDNITVSQSSSLTNSSNKKAIILVFVGMSALAVLIAFTLEYLDNSFKYNEAVEDILGVSVLGCILKKKDNARNEIEYKKVAANLMLNKNEKDKVILFTSSVKNEGKVDTIKNVAKELIEFNKKVVVLNLDKNEEVKESSFDVINMIKTNSDKKSISYNDLKEEIESLRAKYDYIIINGTAINDGIISQIASQDVDTIVFVIKGYSTNKNTVIRAMKELKNINSNINGVVLNNINS